MKVETIESFEVAGAAIRTNNANEMNPETAKIGKLWVQFDAVISPLLTEKSKVYGVYTNYESDWNGAYDVIAAADTLVGQNIADMKTVTIPAGKYLVFSDTGPCPKTCIDLWGKVWAYLTSDAFTHERAYTADFETYSECTGTSSEVSIYIAIK